MSTYSQGVLHLVIKLQPLYVSSQMVLEAKRKAEEERIRIEMVRITTFSLFGLCKSVWNFKTFIFIITLQELAKREVVNVTHLPIPAELGGLLQAVAGTITMLVLMTWKKGQLA